MATLESKEKKEESQNAILDCFNEQLNFGQQNRDHIIDRGGNWRLQGFLSYESELKKSQLYTIN